MADTPAECTTLAELIAAHDAALEQAAFLRAERKSLLQPNGNVLRAREIVRKRDKTTSGNLLRRGVAALGLHQIANVLCVTPVALEEFMLSGRTMSLAQQRTFALALISLSDGHPDLRRRAIGLLGQVRAAEDFEAGVTQRHLDTPPRSHEWR